jgi:hypothetical protein
MIPSLKVFRQGIDVASADNMNTWIQAGALAAQLRSITGLPGMTVMCNGINVVNDGFGGFFYWNADSTEPDDNENFIVPDGTFQGAWWRLSLQTEGPSAPDIFDSDVAILGFLSVSLQNNITATGTTQATAFALTANINIVTTTPAGSGVILPAVNKGGFPLAPGTSVKVYNRGANLLNIYPPVGHQIAIAPVNIPVNMVAAGVAIYDYVGGTQWYVS